MRNNAKQDIKPCPFCGSNKVRVEGRWVFRVHCGGYAAFSDDFEPYGSGVPLGWGCDTKGPLAVTREDAINKWNRRSSRNGAHMKHAADNTGNKVTTNFTTDECLTAYYESLEAEVSRLEDIAAVKDAMIDWLASKLQDYCDSPCRHNCDMCRKGECHNHHWRKAAREAVRKEG